MPQLILTWAARTCVTVFFCSPSKSLWEMNSHNPIGFFSDPFIYVYIAEQFACKLFTYIMIVKYMYMINESLNQKGSPYTRKVWRHRYMYKWEWTISRYGTYEKLRLRMLVKQSTSFENAAFLFLFHYQFWSARANMYLLLLFTIDSSLKLQLRLLPRTMEAPYKMIGLRFRL